MASNRSPRLVPDTIEFAGQRPFGSTWHNEKVPWASRTARWKHCEVVIWDYPHGRAVRASSCTMTGSPTMPPDHVAWEVFEELEGLVDAKLRPGYQLSRVDLARDVVVPDCVEVLRAAMRLLALSGQAYQTYHTWPRALGVVVFPEGLDRLRIYHKGAEVKKEKRYTRMPPELRSVVRVEAQLRKAHLPEETRRHPEGSQSARGGASLVRRFEKERWRPEAVEGEARPRLAPAMPRYVTKLVDEWLAGNALTALVPQLSGNALADWMPDAGI